MTKISNESSSNNHPAKKNLSSKEVKFSDFSDEDKKLFLISDCKLFDPVYLDSLNVVPLDFSKDIDLTFKNVWSEIFFPDIKNAPQSPIASILAFLDAIDFFNSFQGKKESPRVKLLKFIGIYPTDPTYSHEYNMDRYAKCFELKKDTLILDFDFFNTYQEIPGLFFKFKIFNFFSSFCLKRIIVRNFYPRKKDCNPFLSFLTGNQSSIVHLKFNACDFREHDQNCEKLHLPKLESIDIYQCIDFHKLGIQIGTSILSLKLTSVKRYDGWRGEIYTDIFSFSDEYSSDNNECRNPFLSFLQNNPQLESLVYINVSKRIKCEETKKAIFSLPNLKNLNVPIADEIQSYVGSKKIERLVIYRPPWDYRYWMNLAKFPLLFYLRIDFDASWDNCLFSYLLLDRLEYLSIEECEFDEVQKEKFFSAISNLKKLKVLAAQIRYCKGIVLSDSIECLFLKLRGVFSIFDYVKSNYLEYFIEEFLSRLPKGANVKYLEISMRDLANNLKLATNLKDYFPKLEKFGNFAYISLEPYGFSIIKDTDEFPYSFDL